MSLAAFVEDGDGVDCGTGGVCWDGLAGAIGKEGDSCAADEPSLYCVLSAGGIRDSAVNGACD